MNKLEILEQGTLIKDDETNLTFLITTPSPQFMKELQKKKSIKLTIRFLGDPPHEIKETFSVVRK